MEFTYKRRKCTAAILISLVFTFLLALIFWGGVYSEGGPEQTIIHQSKEVEHCILLNNSNENVNTAVHVKQLFNTGFIGIIPGCIFLSFLPFIYFICVCRSKLFCKRKHTLVSLCVRIND